jgi:hypothetical protein
VRQLRTKKERLRIFTLKHELIKISVSLQTAFGVERHLAGGQWLEEQVSVVKL